MPAGYTDGRSWKTAEALLTPVYNFAVGKGCPVGGVGVRLPGGVNNPMRKAQTITEAVAYARSRGAVMFQYFDCLGGRADWQLRHSSPPIPSASSSSAAVQALRAAIAGG